MKSSKREWWLWPLLHGLRVEAVEDRGVPSDVAASAAGAAAGRFAEHAGAPLTSETRQRATAYFWAVVRRRATRHAPGYARRIVRATMSADLEAAGWDPSAISVELERAGLSA